LVRVFRQGQELDLSIELRRSDKTPEQVIDELRGVRQASADDEEPSDA
jgi:hypothetical protein